MQIIIPMSGFGERFRRAGFNTPKPLININDKPIIAHVIDLFPGEHNFIFICNDEHLKNKEYKLKKIINKYCPSGKIISIKAHKLGPVYAVLQAEKFIKDNVKTIVNYCDFSCIWDWLHFKEFVSKTNCDGAIPAYIGFHPHSLGNTNYAYLKLKNKKIVDIQEKEPFTKNKLNEYASSGTYYFSSGKFMKKIFKECIDQDKSVNGEYYVSMAYKNNFKDKKILVYPLKHFMQWGTPEDLSEFNQWNEIFKDIDKPKIKYKKRIGTILMPMAGFGKRFKDEGYKEVKPLINISGKSMFINSAESLPLAKHYHFVLRNDKVSSKKIIDEINNKYKNISTYDLLEMQTEGQACTASIGMKTLSKSHNLNPPITIAACDNAVFFDRNIFNNLINDKKIDIIVWGYEGNKNAQRNPKMFGWIKHKNNIIEQVSVKKSFDDNELHPIIIGTFTFKSTNIFDKVLEGLKEKNIKVNNEYYIDSMINEAIHQNLSCAYFSVKHYISWGTPNDLKTFNYWQSCFHYWHDHPYKIKNETITNKLLIKKINNEFSSFFYEHF